MRATYWFNLKTTACGYSRPSPHLSPFPADKYGDFIEANRTEDPVERLKVLKRLVSGCDQHISTKQFKFKSSEGTLGGELAPPLLFCRLR